MIYETPEDYLLRCAFPRGRMLTALEDELTVFSQLIIKNANKPREDFEKNFDRDYSALFRLAPKTIKNHRTEMITLLGLIVEDGGVVKPSSKTVTLVDSQDFRMFFKAFCNKFQFPNCINKPQETYKQLKASVRFKPAKFILELMKEGERKTGPGFAVKASEVSNLIFNDTRVTSGKFTPLDVLVKILDNRKHEILYHGDSHYNQHGREFLGYMVLAGLLLIDGHNFILNNREKDAVEEIITSKDYFEIPPEYATDAEVRNEVQKKWQVWFSASEERFATPEAAYEIQEDELPVEIPTTAKGSQPISSALKVIGDIGERLVLKFEQDTIGKDRPDKLPLIKIVSNDTSLGYDIQSISDIDFREKKFIEVKTTKRTYAPAEQIVTFFPMSGNEWETAKLLKECYYIYRVFLTSKGVNICVIKNPAEKHDKGLIILEPLDYRVILKEAAIDRMHELEGV
ncbi:MAG: DUF3883 domain-containing protein [Patescibacteria group bacterium]|nr:DUF3883 domain-containing protein [Patescibacteria group bacterium]